MNVVAPVQVFAATPTTGPVRMVNRMSGNMGGAAAPHRYLRDLLGLFGAQVYETDGNEASGRPRERVAAVGVNMDTTTRSMVQEYIRYCLAKSGVNWQNGQRDETVSEEQKDLRAMGDELYARHVNQIEGNVARLNLTRQNGQRELTELMEEMFREGDVSWGRIVTLLVFVGRLACTVRGDEVLLGSVVDWVTLFLDKDEIRSWRTQNGGWSGLRVFRGQTNNKPASNWSPYVAAAGTIAAGLVALSALFKTT